MFCYNCGKEIFSGAKYCVYCGTPVEMRNSDNNDSTDNYRTNFKDRARDFKEQKQRKEYGSPKAIRGGVKAAAILLVAVIIVVIKVVGFGGGNGIPGVYKSNNGAVYVFAKDGTYRQYWEDNYSFNWGTYKKLDNQQLLFDYDTRAYVMDGANLVIFYPDSQWVDFDGERVSRAPTTTKPSEKLTQAALIGTYRDPQNENRFFIFSEGGLYEKRYYQNDGTVQSEYGNYYIDSGILTITKESYSVFATSSYRVDMEKDRIFLYDYSYDLANDCGSGYMWFKDTGKSEASTADNVVAETTPAVSTTQVSTKTVDEMLPADYLGMTVADIVEIYGTDYKQYTWDGREYIYYDYCVYKFCHDPVSDEVPNTEKIISAVEIYVEETLVVDELKIGTAMDDIVKYLNGVNSLSFSEYSGDDNSLYSIFEYSGYQYILIISDEDKTLQYAMVRKA